MSLFQVPQNTLDLIAEFRRLEAGQPLRDVAVASQPLSGRALTPLSPDTIDRFIAELSDPAGRLSLLLFSPVQRRQLSRYVYTDQDVVLTAWSNAAERAAPLSVKGMPSASALEDVRKEALGYRQIVNVAATSINRLLDVRLLLGGLMWFELRAVMEAVVARLEDPATPAAEAAELRDDFGPILLYKDQVLRDREAERAARQADRARTEAELKTAQDEMLLQDVMQAIRLQLPVSPERLAQAVRVMRERQTQSAATAAVQAATAGGVPVTGPAPGAGVGTTGTGRRPIVR